MKSVKLVTPHTHEGISHNVGEIIEMSDADANWYLETVVANRQQTADLLDTPVGKAIQEVSGVEYKAEDNT